MHILNTAFQLFTTLVTPVLITLIVLGIFSGVLKVSTQIEDRSLGFAVKFLAVIALSYFFIDTWALNIFEFTKQIWDGIEYYKPIV